MKRIYNTGFEIEPRIVLIAQNYPFDSFSEDAFVALDFMAVYGHEFVETLENLHGDNIFKFSEITARRQIVREALKNLVLNGFIRPFVDNGFRYAISDIGKNYAESLESSYSSQYKKNLSAIYQRFSNYDDNKLYNIVREMAVQKGGEEG